jgi:hypothetical protein
MKQNLKEELERNRELMGLPINEGTGVLDKLKDLFGLGYEKVMDFIKKDEEEIESEFGEIDDLKSDDVEKIAKYYEEEEGVDLDRDVSGNLKDFFKSEGIKYNDIDSGGDIDAEASIKFKAVLKSLVNEIPDLKIKITSGNDLFHKSKGKSNHSAGRALDLTISPKNDEMVEKVYYAFCNARKKFNGFSFIDEYKFPSAGATGGHFHISYNPERTEDASTTKKICDNLKMD